MTMDDKQGQVCRRRAQQEIRFHQTKQALEAWFTPERWDMVYPILTNTDPDGISSRLLEFLVTKYASKNSVRYYIAFEDGTRHLVDLYIDLQTLQLTKRKKNIEPFARINAELPKGGRFSFGYGDKVKETNIAQLQFMRFMLEKEAIQWVRIHIDELKQAKKDYETRHKENPRERPESDERIAKRRKCGVVDQSEIDRIDNTIQARRRNVRRRYRHAKKHIRCHAILPIDDEASD